MRLKRLTNFFIEALFSLERAKSGLPHPDAVDPDEIDDPEECNQQVEEAKINIMNLQGRYGPDVPGLTEKGVKIYRNKISKYFYEVYSDDLLAYPRVNDDIVNQFIRESIDESKSAGKSKKKKKKKATKKKKKVTKKKKKTKLAGNPKCSILEENDCKSNDRCTWNEFHIEDFDMNTSKGKQKLFDLKESLMKIYTKDELREYLGSDKPSFYQVYMRAKKEYDNGLRGLCGHKILKGSELIDMLEKKVKKDYPDIKSKKKSKVPQKDKGLVEDLLKEAMKKSKPNKEIKAIIDMYGLQERELREIYDKNNKQFAKLDKFLSVDYDEVSSLMGMAEDEVKLEKKGYSDLQERIDRLKGLKSGKSKKKNKKAKKKKKQTKKAKK